MSGSPQGNILIESDDLDTSKVLNFWLIFKNTIIRLICGHLVACLPQWYFTNLTQMFHKEPFFHGTDNTDQLLVITKVLGSSSLFAYLTKYEINLPTDLRAMVSGFERREWSEFRNSENERHVSLEGLELLGGLLRYDHAERKTPREAMAMAFFSEVRAFHNK